MRLLLPVSVSLLLAWQAARAQTAADFFNSGAHFYISNNIPEALAPVEHGLKQYPDDVKLKKLYELLKQQQQQQQSQQNQQNQSQQQKSNGQQNQKQSQQNSQQQKQDEDKQSAQQKAEQQKQQQQKSGEKQENQNEQGQPSAAGQMTPEVANRLLDAQKGNEQFLQLKPQGKPENPNQVIKDW